MSGVEDQTSLEARMGRRFGEKRGLSRMTQFSLCFLRLDKSQERYGHVVESNGRVYWRAWSDQLFEVQMEANKKDLYDCYLRILRKYKI